MRSFRFASHPSFRLLTLVSLLVVMCVPVAFAQTPAASSAPATTPDWETLRPDGEEFSVLMPKGSISESGKEPYHKMELSTRTYISKLPSGTVFAVVSLSGIKSNPALYTEMQRVNSYVDAFKDIFTPKVRKGAIAKLTLAGNKTLQGNAGRDYRMTLGDLSGTVQVYATRKRFYAIVHLSPKKEDEIQKEFLTSFVLPEKIEPATAAAQPPATTPEAEAALKPKEPGKEQAKEQDNAESKPADQTPGQPGKRAPISAGVLNGKALSLPKPEIPPDAKAAGTADGVVVVQVLIDEQGSVTEAKAISGPPLLQQVSVNAALQAKFSPTLLQGEPVKVTGVLVYNFGHPMS